MTKPTLLPADRIGLSRDEAAAYINVSPNTFDLLVSKGVMPKAKRIGTRRVWSRRDVELAFERLDNDEPGDKPSNGAQDERGTPPWEGRAA